MSHVSRSPTLPMSHVFRSPTLPKFPSGFLRAGNSSNFDLFFCSPQSFPNQRRCGCDSDLSVVKFSAMALDREEFLDALWHGVAEAPATFACGGAVDGAKHQQLPRSLWLEGLGDLPLPLSLEDVSRIRDTALAWKADLQKCFGGLPADLEEAPHDQTWDLQLYDTYKFLRRTSGKQFMNSVYDIAEEAVGRLGQNAESLTLEVTPEKIVCYEQGGDFRVTRDNEFMHMMGRAGTFGWLLLQLPVEDGHTGGASVLVRRKDTKKLECSRGSSKGFHFTAFYDECQFRVEEITSGRRVCLVFSLVSKDSRPTPMPGFSCFVDAVVRVEAALLPWLENLKESEAVPQRLFIPLQQKYSGTSFARLQGQDRNVGDLLRFCGGTSCSNGGVALEVFLCTLTCTKYEDYDSDSSPGVYARDQIHRTVSRVHADGWIGPNDRAVTFPRMNIINFDSEVVIPKGKHDPFSEEDVETDHNYHLDEVRYHIAAFLVFPKNGGLGTLVAGCGGMRAALDLVESKQKHRAPETPAYLRQLLDFCTQYPSRVWDMHKNQTWESPKHVNSTCRLLELCVKVGDCQDVIRLIKILGRNYKSKSGGAFWYPGIGGPEAAQTLASVVKSLGWDACGNAIVKYLLLQSRLGHEAESFVELALELRKLGCHEAALVVARRTYSLVPSALGSLKPHATVSIAYLLFSLLHEHIPAFVDRMQAVATSTLSDVVADLLRRDTLGLKEDVNLLNNFSKLCHIMAENVHCPSLQLADSKWRMYNVVHSILWLADASVLESAVQKALQQSRQSMRKGQTLLKELMAELERWMQGENSPCKDSSMAIAAWKTVATEWIRKVSSTPKPAFTWSQPLANLPDFPDVEAFLRGPDQTCYRCGIHSLPEARKFAKKYFDGSYNLKDGFSAQGTPGGRGPDAHCKIEKTDAVYLAVVKAWEDEQKEAAELRSKIACIGESPVAKRLKTALLGR